MPRPYLIYDVFTDTPFEGNPLAVVLEADGLDDGAMQTIAREFNLSETVFVQAPASDRHTARLRIFTPAYELPFAGHPTVGTAVALSNLRGSDASIMMLEEEIGLVRCVVGDPAPARFCEFDLPQLPQALPLTAETASIAHALGIDPHRIGFENHVPTLFSAGNPYVLVPVADLDAAASVQLDPRAWMEFAPVRPSGSVACPYVYCRQTRRHDRDFHARMLVPNGGTVYEDPATGSAAAAFAGAIAQFDGLMDGPTSLWIEQGVEMGRPSAIRLELDVEGGAIAAARIGGQAVKIADGTINA